MTFFLFFLAMIHAQLSPQNLYVQGYAEKAYSQYSRTTAEAQKLDSLIQDFVAQPTHEKMELAKQQWIEARKMYSQTEVYRFFDGPIDDADGPEGMINAWPIDEAYIDSVRGKLEGGIINNRAAYPTIDKNLVLSLNEMNGEKNISTGWHAIEFLLWGQDFSTTGPGQRSFEDYVDGIGKNADRRGLYLSVISALLVEQLQSVTAEWNPQSGDYYQTFISTSDSLAKLTESLRFLAGEELSIERMYVAYDTQDQEDEHSCFSDTTHNDLYNNFLGIKGVLTENYNGISLISLISEKDSALASSIEAQILALDLSMGQFPAPFDQAIFDPDARVKIKSIIDSLQALADDIEKVKKDL